jgi:hypothetical protein
MDHSNIGKDNSGRSRGIVDRVKDQATTQITTQKDRATDGLGSIAAAIRQSSQPLRDNNQEMLADYVARAADQIDRFSTRLGESDVNALIEDAKRFAHRRPAVVVGAAFAAGIIAARFLKSSGAASQQFAGRIGQVAHLRESRHSGGF